MIEQQINEKHCIDNNPHRGAVVQCFAGSNFLLLVRPFTCTRNTLTLGLEQHLYWIAFRRLSSRLGELVHCVCIFCTAVQSVDQRNNRKHEKRYIYNHPIAFFLLGSIVFQGLLSGLVRSTCTWYTWRKNTCGTAEETGDEGEVNDTWYLYLVLVPQKCLDGGRYLVPVFNEFRSFQ